ncbi:hypothetical protein [Agromyces aureus]|uniref:Sporulation protein n=1 Tax=Agromyces aureus TaxID=453304 RepID=A0A191WEX4_9MICO|nr:hypothetical protein [Agromyces aureus]ANJ26772.1 hypothetical protein ATC03_08660 [Agromyces aureus]
MAELVLDLADRVAGVGVKTAYGDKIEIEGIEVVPVALGYYAFGGGNGTGDATSNFNGSGSAGGGGSLSVPLGAYVGDGGRVRFDPNLIGLVLVATPFVFVVGHALKSVIRALKR